VAYSCDRFGGCGCSRDGPERASNFFARAARKSTAALRKCNACMFSERKN
jgi:hypothetical protein